MKIKKCIASIILTILISIDILNIYSSIAYAFSEELSSAIYNIHDNYIERVYPETSIDKFKQNIKEDVVIYENKSKTTIIKDGIIKTGMVACVANGNINYEISVIGDINGDGLLNQIDVNLLIKHIIGLKDYTIKGLKLKSADIKHDSSVNQIDLKNAIDYVAKGKLEEDIINPQRDTIPPTISLKEPEEYTSQKTIITAEIIDEQTGIAIQKWAKGEKDINYFKENGNIFTGKTFEVRTNGIYTVYAKDNSGNENVKQINVTKIDSLGPIINSLKAIRVTTNQIEVKIEAHDDRGLAEEDTYTYYISTNEDFSNEEVKTSIESNCIFDRLKQNTNYYIKVKVKDKLENITESEAINIKTPKIPMGIGTTPEGSILLEVSETTWEEEKANIVITNRSDIYAQYKILDTNGNIIQDWTTMQKINENIGNLYHNYSIITRLSDSISTIEGNFGEEKVTIITDNNIPNIELKEQEEYTNTNSVITVNIYDNESGILIQKWAKGNQSIEYFKTQGNQITNGKFEADENSIYTVYAKDKAENETIKTIEVTKIDKERPIVTIQIPPINSILKQGDIIQATIEVSKEIEKIDESKIKLEGAGAANSKITKKQNENNTISLEIVVGNGNGEINLNIQEGAFTDTIGNTNRQTTKNNIAQIDNKGPNITSFKVVQTTTNSIKVDIQATDVGIAGLDTQNTYAYYIDTSSNFENEKVVTSNNKSYVIGGLTQNKTYYIKVVVKDSIGNKTTSQIITGTTKIVPNAEDLVQGSTKHLIEMTDEIWASEKAKTTITNNSSYYMQYRIINKNAQIVKDWTNVESSSITVSDLYNGYLVVARLSDSKETKLGNYGGETTNLIFDTIYPKLSVAEQSQTTNTQVTVTATIVENESGIEVRKWQSGQRDETYFKTQGNTFTGNTFQVSANGLYTVYIRDRAGNEAISTVQVTKLDTNVPAILQTKIYGNASNIVKRGTTLKIICTPNKTISTIDQSKITLSGAGATGSSKTVTKNSDGTITVTITAGSSNGAINIVLANGAIKDTSGNLNRAQTISNVVMVDNQVPTIQPIQLMTTSVNTISIKVIAQDVGAAGLATDGTYAFYISEGKTFTNASSITANNYYTFRELKQDTKYYIKVVVKDAVGNQAQSQILEQTTDSASEASIKISEVQWENGKASVSASTESEELLIQYKVLNQNNQIIRNWTESEKGVYVTDLYNNYKIIVRLIDKDGKNYSDEKTIVIKDEITPTIELSEQDYYSKERVIITSRVDENESGIKVQKWAQGERTISYFSTRGTTYTGNTFNVTANGIYTVYVSDNAGNEAIETIEVTKIDNEGPQVEVEISDITATGFTLGVTASDELSGLATDGTYRYYLSTSSILSGQLQETTTESSYRYEVSTARTYYVYVIVSDEVGNETTSERIKVQISNVAQIGSTKYMSLQEAINDIPKNNRETTISLLSNIEEHIVVEQYQNIILEANGHTISNSEQEVIVNDGKLTINNGIIEQNGTNYAILNTGELTLAEQTEVRSSQYGVNNLTGGILNIQDAIITIENTEEVEQSYAINNMGETYITTITINAIKDGIYNGENAILEIYGGEIIANESAIINEGGIITILDGNITSESDLNSTIYNKLGTTDIQGGTIENRQLGYAIYKEDGEITVSDTVTIIGEVSY